MNIEQGLLLLEACLSTYSTRLPILTKPCQSVTVGTQSGFCWIVFSQFETNPAWTALKEPHEVARESPSGLCMYSIRSTEHASTTARFGTWLGSLQLNLIHTGQVSFLIPKSGVARVHMLRQGGERVLSYLVVFPTQDREKQGRQKASDLAEGMGPMLFQCHNTTCAARARCTPSVRQVVLLHGVVWVLPTPYHRAWASCFGRLNSGHVF